MANITRDITVNLAPAAVWQAVRDVGNAHVKLFPGILTGITLEGGARIVTFANGMVLRELIVDIDDAAMRVVYASVGGRATHHNASLQVMAAGAGASRIVWVTDFLPGDLAPMIGGLMDMGMATMKKTLEA